MKTASSVSTYLVRAFGRDFGQPSHVTLWRVLIAGFGAIAVFRSSLFVAKVGGSEVNVGPMVIQLAKYLGAPLVKQVLQNARPVFLATRAGSRRRQPHRR